MDEIHAAASAHRVEDASAGSGLGAPLGIAASLLGLAIFLGACFGFEAALTFSTLPLAFGAIGMVLTIVRGVRMGGYSPDTAILASVFVNLMAILGALVELAAWRHWTILPH